jgi:hypothetical protein
MWDEFEHTRPLSEPEVTQPTEEEPTVTLEKRDTTPLATER